MTKRLSTRILDRIEGGIETISEPLANCCFNIQYYNEWYLLSWLPMIVSATRAYAPDATKYVRQKIPIAAKSLTNRIGQTFTSSLGVLSSSLTADESEIFLNFFQVLPETEEQQHQKPSYLYFVLSSQEHESSRLDS